MEVQMKFKFHEPVDKTINYQIQGCMKVQMHSKLYENSDKKFSY